MAKKRDEFKDNYKWNVKDIYPSDEDVLKEIKYLEKHINEYQKYQGHILDNASNLLELLQLDSNLGVRLEKVFVYAHLNNDADTLNTKYQELFGKAKNIYTKYIENTSFIVPEMLLSDEEVVLKYLEEEPKLKRYKRILKNIYRNKKHILDSEVEKSLSSFAKLMDAPDEIMSSLQDSDFKFANIIVNGKEEELTESNYSLYIRSEDRNVRKEAFQSLYKTYSNFKTAIATIMRSEVEKNVAMAKLRKYKNTLEASLFHNEIKPSVYYNLINSVHKNLPSIYKYWRLKKELLNLDEMHLYDTYADIKTEKSKKTYTFEEARDLVLEIVKPLGSTYVSDLTKAFQEKWIDSCNNVGKRGGAYCTACYGVHPYVLMSFEGDLNDVSTLAHELGHAMHYYYAINNQNYEDYNYSIFVAEVASQVNEILLSRFLLDNSNDPKEKIQIIDELLQKYKASIFRQTMFAEFELFMNEYTEKGNVLTSEVMNNKYYELNKLYFGKDVIVDDEIKYEWERIPHFYMNYYVYQYATGFAAAINIANKIYDGDEVARDNYLKFLKLGCTKNPIASLKVAGLDMESEEVMDNAIKFMDELIDEYEKLLKDKEVSVINE